MRDPSRLPQKEFSCLGQIWAEERLRQEAENSRAASNTPKILDSQPSDNLAFLTSPDVQARFVLTTARATLGKPRKPRRTGKTTEMLDPTGELATPLPSPIAGHALPRRYFQTDFLGRLMF